MNIRLHKANNAEIKQIEELYYSAFPKEERTPFPLMKLRAKQNKGVMLAACENGRFVGFAYVIEHKDCAYLFYLAIIPEMRGTGLGTAILDKLKEHYKRGRLFLAREALDPSSDNYEQRVRRHNFYIRNGFEDYPCKIHEGTVTFETMGIGGMPTSEDYDSLISRFAGRLFMKFFPMYLTND